MPKVKITSAAGVVETAGSTGIEFDASPLVSLQALVSSSTAPLTLSLGGVYTVSGTGATQVVMPTAASVPGATFIVRSASAYAHWLTGSAETAGTQVFAGFVGATGVSGSGSKLALPAVVGSSVAVVSDGASYLLTAMSGTCVISGT